MSVVPQPLPASERDLARRWASPGHAPFRLEDGRGLRIVFPGVPAGGSGPDYQGAILDIEGDLVRGDVELHLLASGWFAHGHHRDRAYDRVILHAVAANDIRLPHTLHRGHAVPLLVLPPPAAAQPPPFTPPCALAAARGQDPSPALLRLGRRRLRAKAAALQPLAAQHGPAGALYGALLRVLGGPANAGAFAALAVSWPLPALLEAAQARAPVPPALALRALLAGALPPAALVGYGQRPAASPGRRLDLAARLVASLWPDGPAWPFSAPEDAFPAFRRGGASRALAVELAANAALPAFLAAGLASEEAALAAWEALPSPGTYGVLRPLEGWLAHGGPLPPFRSAAALQGGLALHRDYCTRGFCGRCPLSSAPVPVR